MEAQDTHLPLTNDRSHVSDGLPGQEFAPSDPNLCNVCNFILQNEVELGQDCKHPHQSNLFELERAAQDGCHLCRLILSSIRPGKLQKLRVHHDRVQRWLKPESKAREGLVWYCINQYPHGFEINFRGRISEESPWETSNRFLFSTVGYFSSKLIEVEGMGRFMPSFLTFSGTRLANLIKIHMRSFMIYPQPSMIGPGHWLGAGFKLVSLHTSSAIAVEI
jgi:hypothetical protein